VKWEPVVAMLALVALGLWLVWGPGDRLGMPAAREGARLVELRLHNDRGALEIVEAKGDQPASFRLLFRDGSASEVLSVDVASGILPGGVFDRLMAAQDNPMFRVLNITGWGSLLWVLIGFGGQAAFSGRFVVQWLVSEKQKRSVVPEAFWWMSLVGGVGLFTYFAWRQDIVGVLGQSSGLVIYARNIRLIHKRRRREARREGMRGVGGVEEISEKGVGGSGGGSEKPKIGG